MTNNPLPPKTPMDESARRAAALKREQGTVDRITAGSRSLRSFVEILNSARGEGGMALLKAVAGLFKEAVARIGAAVRALADKIPGGLESLKGKLMPVGRFLVGSIKKMRKTYNKLSFPKMRQPMAVRSAAPEKATPEGLNNLLAANGQRIASDKAKARSDSPVEKAVKRPAAVQLNKSVMALLMGGNRRGARS